MAVWAVAWEDLGHMNWEASSHPDDRQLCGLSDVFTPLLLGSTLCEISVFNEVVPKFLTVPTYMFFLF